MIFDALAARRGVRTVRANARLMPFLSCIALTVISTSIAHSATSPQQPKVNKADVVRNFGRLPIAFEPNVGQTDHRVDYVSHGGSYNLFLTPGAVVLSLSKQTSVSAHTTPPRFETDTVRMDLVGASKVHGVANNKLAGKSNYITGSKPKFWHTNIPTYGKVSYAGVYPGIDLTYYGNSSHLEYDFTVAPGSDPGKIALQITGAKSQSVGSDGKLILNLPLAPVAWDKPIAYQMSNGVRQLVSSRYVLSGSVAKIVVGSYDHSKPLVIDPVLVYGTYFPSTTINSIALNSAGQVFASGFAFSPAFPTTAGALDAIDTGTFISRINSSGTGLVYSTFLGFFGAINAMAIDPSNNAYVGGQTFGSGIPTTANALQASPLSTNTGFLVEINSSGSILNYGSYIGGAGTDSVDAIAANPANTVAVVGSTSSTNLPTTSSAYQSTYTGTTSTNFVGKFLTTASTAAAATTYLTYFGGTTGTDTPTGVGIDPILGNVYVTGQTTSTDFPHTVSAAYGSIGSAFAGFLFELNAAGAGLQYSTYIPGTSPRGLSFVSANSVYVGGTASAAFTASNSIGSSPNNLFVSEFDTTKLNAASQIFATAFGGSASYFLNSYTTDTLGASYFTGSASNGIPLSADSLQPYNASFTNSNEPFFSVLDNTGTTLKEMTYFGGADLISANSIAGDGVGGVYIGGTTSAPDMPTTPGAYAVSPPSGSEFGFLDKFTLATPTGPQINYFNPSVVFTTGSGTVLSIFGAGFNANTTVSLNSTNVTPVTFINPNELQVTLSSAVLSSGSPIRVTTINTTGLVGSYSLNLATINPNPTVLSISPSPIQTSTSDVFINVFGLNFRSGATVRINGTLLPVSDVTFFSSTDLEVQIPFSFLTAPTTLTVRVTNPAPATVSSSITLQVVSANSTAPQILSLSPPSIEQGSPAFILTINGQRFDAGCSVSINGTVYTPDSASFNTVTVRVPASVVAAAGTVPVFVDNGSGLGGTSNTVNLLVTIPAVPAISSLSPLSVYAGGPSFTLTVNGSGFSTHSVVNVDGIAYPVNSGIATSITATVPSSVIATVGTGTRTVFVDNGIGFGGQSNSTSFAVIATPTPTLTSISPSQVVVGTTGLQITLTGTGFYPQSEVKLGASVLPALSVTYVSPTQLLAFIPDSSIASPNAGIPVRVINPSPDGSDGGTTAAVNLVVISNASPTITSLSPSTVQMGSPATLITVTGTNFNTLSTVAFNGTVPVGGTTYISPTQVSAILPVTDTNLSGNVTVTVTNPAPGGGVATANLPITQPVPVLTLLSPSTYILGTSTSLTITGTGFTGSSTVTFTGTTPADAVTVLPTNQTSTTLTLSIPNNLPVNGGSVEVRVTNPAPGGGTSNFLTLTLTYPAPVLTSISPAIIPQGATGEVMTLSGTGFAAGDTVVYNNGTASSLTVGTTYVSGTTLTTIVPQSITAAVGTAQVQVLAPGQTISTAQTLTISAITITGFTLTPTTVVGGNNVSASITLGSTAPTGGVVVALSLAAGPAADVAFPATVTVPAGSNTVTFTTIQTHVVSGTATVTLAATVGSTSVSAILTITGVGGGTFNGGLNFFSVPYTYSNILQNIFVSNTTNGEIANWDPTLLAYNVQGGGLVTPTSVSIVPGMGYWGRFPSNGDSLLYLGVPASSTVPTVINLAAGWNSIGDPYTTSVNISTLTFTSNNYTFAQAISPTFNLISPTLYFFLQDASKASGSYSPIKTGSALQPGVGYWIYSFFATTLRFPLPQTTTTTTTTTTTRTGTGTTSTTTIYKKHKHH